MTELVRDMVKDDPEQMTEVVSRFENIVKSLSSWKLRSRVVDADDRGGLSKLFRSGIHWVKQFGFIVRSVPPIPTP